MTIEQRIKSAVWTEAEVGAVVIGAIIGGQFVDDRKIFKKDFAEHPEWFAGPRTNAPFIIKWSGALKAGAALFVCTYVTNPWLKLFLMGIAFQGTLQQARIITWNEKEGIDRIHMIGDGKTASELDAKLRNLAEQYRASRGPEYIEGADPIVNQYSTSVAGPEAQSSRYSTSVAGVYDEDEIFDRPVHGKFEDSGDVFVS